ncbi:hypothetical protein ACSX1A_16365 [Pontibacter sp. MBLB2868]|uniref:toxin-antitoxin system YwqK family antitoxin n=1 Tax=Pontibacter sp. MBLB2868 TaxID=3451555 RepID=UPI003F74E1CF
MKKLLLILAALLFISPIGFAQKLTLTELMSLCGKQNWESVNTTLLTKGWIYHDSQKGDSDHYNTITWSYNKNSYNNKAQGWFYLFTYNSQPDKVSYVTLSKTFYTQIQSSLTSSGYKLLGSKIEDSEVVSTYANATYAIKVSTQRRDEDEWSDASLTAYQITVIRKAGIYDPDNGNKISYYADGEVETEYSLKNGKLHGLLKIYYESGQLKKQGTYTDGKGNGKFVEYDEYGNKTAEYSMVNDEYNGVATIYEDSFKSIEKEYVNGEQTGRYVEYYYDEGTGEPTVKIIGSTKKGEKDGKWTTYYVGNGEEEVLEFSHYLNGVKHGAAEEFAGSDTIVTALYANGELHGAYKRRVKVKLTISKTGETDFIWIDDCEGSYKMGLKSGKWTYLGFTGKESEGNYVDGLKEGKWTYYAPVSDRLGEVMLETYFTAGKKQGVEKRFLFIDETERLVEGKSEIYFKAIPVLETTTYNRGIKSGSYELRDSTNTLIRKGNYLNDEKHGAWLEAYQSQMPDGANSWFFFEGEYKNGKEEGKWIGYYDKRLLTRTMNFKEGKLHGEYIEWNKYGKPAEKKIFHNDDFAELTIYDSTGDKILTKYEIYDENSSSLMCRQTEYFDSKITSQEFKIFRQEEIDHNDFERVFLNLTGITSNGIYGYKDGEFRVTDINGNPVVTGKYRNEDKIGLWVYYFPEQDVKIESNYANNVQLDEKYLTLNNSLFSGEFVYHDAKTGLKEERKIKNGLRNGKTAFIDGNNKVVKKESYKDGVLK